MKKLILLLLLIGSGSFSAAFAQENRKLWGGVEIGYLLRIRCLISNRSVLFLLSVITSVIIRWKEGAKNPINLDIHCF
jgi:hypothetical protein